MGKKYLDTKETSLESSILGVWAEAAKKTESVDIDESTGKEIAAKMMKDKSMKAFASKVAKMKTVTRDDLEKLLPDYVDGGSITGLFKEEVNEGTKEEYQKFFNAAMKKFGIDSPADLKSDEEKKKFFDYVDKNYKGEKDEEFNAFMKEKLGESFEFGTLEYRNHALNVTPGETDPEWARARDFKVASMKEALAKVWGFDEKVLDKSSKEAYDEEDEELKPVPGSKTMTGGKVAKVDTKPKID